MHKLTAIGLAAMLAWSAAACTPASDSPSDPPASDPPASAPASAPATDPASPAASETPAASASAVPSEPTPADPSQPSGGDQLGEVVATRVSSSGGSKVQLNLYPIQRDGTTSHLNFSLTSGSPSSSDHVSVFTLLTDGDGSVGDRTSAAADGLQLVDGKHSKLYLVASDGKGTCLCSRNLLTVRLEKGAPVLFSATFAAPPADVTSVDVRIPQFGTVKSVPVQ